MAETVVICYDQPSLDFPPKEGLGEHLYSTVARYTDSMAMWGQQGRQGNAWKRNISGLIKTRVLESSMVLLLYKPPLVPHHWERILMPHNIDLLLLRLHPNNRTPRRRAEECLLCQLLRMNPSMRGPSPIF